LARLKTILHLINLLDKTFFSPCYLLVRDSHNSNYANSEKVSYQHQLMCRLGVYCFDQMLNLVPKDPSLGLPLSAETLVIPGK